MLRRSLRGLRSIAHIGILFLALIGTIVTAQDVTEPALKATFIYNFAKFTTWPEDLPAAEPWVMCVLGDAAVGDALTRTVEGRALAGHRMTVLQMTPVPPTVACHVLYVSGVTPGEAARLVAGLSGQPVLTISDIRGFTGLGGIAQCYFEYGQMRFSVRLASAARVHLQISSRLLMLARLE
jgi:YfiR/HmsC-like